MPARSVGGVGDRVGWETSGANGPARNAPILDVLDNRPAVELGTDRGRLGVKDHVVMQVAVRRAGLARREDHLPHADRSFSNNTSVPTAVLASGSVMADSLQRPPRIRRPKEHTVTYPYCSASIR